MMKPGSVTHKAVSKVKETPQKIIEHAVNRAITTVEKAAETEVKRTEKRAARTQKKLKKVQKQAQAAQTAVKRASSLSNSANRLSETNLETISSQNIKNKINRKIREIITPIKETTFYYDHRQLIVLLGIYSLIAVFIYIISECLLNCNLFNNWLLLIVLIITQVLSLLALISIFFVVFFPQKLAVVTNDGIKIDPNQLLKWEDIETAEEKYTSYISRRPFMALHLKDGTLSKYRLTFMQKLCKNNVFTPFSIPMYAMRPEDAAHIRELIKKQTKYEDNRN